MPQTLHVQPVPMKLLPARLLDVELAVRFLFCMLVAWLFMFLIDIKWFVDYYLPYSFHLLNLSLVLGVCGLGYPFALATSPPLRASGLILRGVLQTGFWICLALAIYSIQSKWVGLPEPGGVYFGITLFMFTLWYALSGVGPHPFGLPGTRYPVWSTVLFSWFTIMALTIPTFIVFVNFEGLPPTMTMMEYDPMGVFAAQEWFDRCVWVIVWIQVFGSLMCFQGWPFLLLPAPLYQISYTVGCILLGAAFYELTKALNIDMNFSASAVGATMISFSVYHAVGFDLRPFASRYIQPMRGVLNFVTEEIIFTAVWIIAMRGILSPMKTKCDDAGPPYNTFTLNNLTAWYSLHLIAPLIIVHQLFFFRYPMIPPGPPLGPFEFAEGNRKFDWFKTRRLRSESNIAEAEALENDIQIQISDSEKIAAI